MIAELGPMFNWEISVGSIINIGVLAVGLIWFFYGLKGRLDIVEHDLKTGNGIAKLRTNQIAGLARLDTVEKRLNRLDTVLDQLQRALNRLDLTDERLLSTGKRLDELTRRFSDWLGQTYEERHEALRQRIEGLEVEAKRQHGYERKD